MDIKTAINNGLFEQAVQLVNRNGQPNINALWHQLKELNAIKWSVKQEGYAIASHLAQRIAATDVPKAPDADALSSKAATQKDVESRWFRYWIDQIHCAPIPHRKLWEFAYILQNMHALAALQPGHRALGFGCGEEPLPSYLAGKGLSVTVTDLMPDKVAGRGWAESGQHTASLDASFYDYLVSRKDFDDRVELKYVDMNDIPSELNGQYDLCWSVCALEHLGSIEKGLAFIENSLKTLKPGGVAVHTTEFNYTETDRTIDNWPTVLFLRKHFQEIEERLTKAGHSVQPLDFRVGLDPMDSFVDLPPYANDPPFGGNAQTPGEDHVGAHLKLSVDGFPSTCFGMTIRKSA